MKSIQTLVLFCIFFAKSTLAQPTQNIILSDVKKEMGPNCIEVKVTGKGSLVEENENGSWITYFRIPTTAILKTDLPGVTRLMKGAAVYTKSGSNFLFKKYNTATGEYIGLPAPNVEEIKLYLQSLPDLGLGGHANIITDVSSIQLDNSAPVWHTLLSVSINAEYIYWYKKSDFELEQIKEPFELRLYRKSANEQWFRASLMTPNAAKDKRRKEVLGQKAYAKEKTILEKGMLKMSETHLNSLPSVTVPKFNSINEAADWVNALLIEGDPNKAEKMFLMLFHPSQKSETGILYPYAQELIQKMKLALTNGYSQYNKQFCPEINIKEQPSASSIEWWNKDKTKFCRMNVQFEQSKMYLTELNINLWQQFNSKNAEQTMNAICK